MAFRTLSTFPSLPHGLTKSNPKPTVIFRKPIAKIVCKSVTPSGSPLQVTVSEPDSDGTGAAAPTPGERFLERQRAHESARTVMRELKKEEKKKKKKENPRKVVTSVACCYGCGAPLQTCEADSPGYVDPGTYELKKKHHQLRTVICGRCKLLSHGHMITAVGGNGGYPGGKQFISADELREKLSHLRHEKAFIVKLVDIVDFNGSFLSHVRDLVGANPITLVVTKVDLLPRGTDMNCVGDWVVELTTKKKLNVLSVHLTSSKSLAGISGVASEIQKEKKGRDVYILGAANVGKSAFINALLKTMAERDPAAAAAQKYKPIQSAVPGTTLGPIQIDAFLGGGKLYDTPGVHLHHRQAAVVHSDDLPALAPQSRLRGQSFHISTLSSPSSYIPEAKCLEGYTFFWGGLVRVDVLKVLPETCLTFYGPKALQIHAIPTEKADGFYHKEVGVLLTPPSGKQKTEEWKGLESRHLLRIKFGDTERPASDVAISGLGWISIEPIRRTTGSEPRHLEDEEREICLAISVPKPVEVFVRPPLPVGTAGAGWYQYRELTDKEEETRPRWYF
ncbi:PREDICTED: NO-associated protein 1, chloroplastic/mitochondrial [Tarenaya hassleriana]|uniref:NO-associated protein 1, chloroplastic/mitochondrial n=1 Tax=Tarenaya hassleriana TaxID=28532 RepID=UPI00053C43DC|nr:PREDICTED: NO-associated protein 1, chloroplastic/mitochondrial [Tarenaya hassleriana]